MSYILTVDDDPEILETLRHSLTKEQHIVAEALNAEDGFRQIVKRRPDLVILDIMMPGKDGLWLCRELRADPRYNDLLILFLTGIGGTEDVIRGLDAGGDDYVIKPFQQSELKARVRALLRRVINEQGDAVLTINHIRLDSDTFQVTNGSHVAQLTATEHRLLRFLMEHAGQALSTQKLLEKVWDYPPRTGDPDLVRAHIRNLRQKIEPDDTKREDFIRTIHGVGYMITITVPTTT